MRQLFHDVPIKSDYVVCLNDDSLLLAGWWEALGGVFNQGIDYVGQSSWHPYSAAQLEAVQSFPWYMGVPFDRREGKPGVSYMRAGFMAVRSEGLRQANFPDLSA